MKRILGAIGVLILFGAALVAIPLLLSKASDDSQTLGIVTTNFPAYDFARAVTKGVPNIKLEMLVPPGGEVHTFEPTAGDIKAIEKSRLFIYNGGESENWAKQILENLNTKETKVLRMMDLVEVKTEEIVEGMDHEDHDEHEPSDDPKAHDERETSDDHEEIDYDEHIWTSPKNAVKITKQIKDALVTLDPAHQKQYEENAKVYIDSLTALDQDFQNAVQTAKRTEIIFGDRFPLRYFVDEYGLKYYAAFPGCSEQTEASSKTIAFLIDKVKTDKIPVVFKIELSNGRLAEEIASDTGATVLEFHAMHNISKTDFENDVTYLDLMRANLENLRKALN